jgi:kumamolisin
VERRLDPRDDAPVGQALGPTDPDQRIELSLILRPRRPLAELEARLNEGLPPLTREQYAASYGADPADVATVEAFARGHGLELIESSPERRTVRVAGRAADISSLFGTGLAEYRAADGTVFRAPTGEMRVPDEIAGVVQSVFGLDTRPQARHY